MNNSDNWDSYPVAGPPPLRAGAASRTAAAVDLERAEHIEAGEPDRSRRLHDRVTGPFDGRRLGLLETPVRLYDLSLGGCFVNSLHDQQEGTTLGLKIDLPEEGWVTVTAETIYRRPGFGFAVRFVNLSEETAACLERAIDAIKAWRRPGE